MKGPGIVFPPPLILVAGFVIGLGLDQLYPAPLKPLAWLLVVLGLAITAWALASFKLAKTPIFPNKDATQLVVKGPYRFSRNPMYLGLAVSYLGLALWLTSPFALALLPVSLYVLWLLVIRREEAHLLDKFGEDYRHYCDKVRRWY
ncbi:methyltransferase family protein [Gallaecimonas xiamenensis]|uniref:Isoprenylcysteine carboxyl methyltransferase n=1 Tax=Gallaecimonas xiamenensis 3-C-1 TaxID=745411 RepID=K2KD09_9GAMM|nr:isoprenylcysteine carboxylmethyltransferase family protein [Gallaecimonas xiamenensis]EKE75135.1 hypothetical protein B3C1_07661 [Gallaecimonas xiamenensis 3-C-1]